LEKNSCVVKSSEKTKKGRIFKKSLGQYFLHSEGKVVVCSISSKLRKQLIYPLADPMSIRPHVVAVKGIKAIDPIAINDTVLFIDSKDGTGVITEILPRKNKFSRRAAGKKVLEQVIATNIDQTVIVLAAVHPAPKWRMLDRYLADAEFLEVPVVICVTKMDVAKEDFLTGEIDTYSRIGYPVVFTSAITHLGIEEIVEVLKDRVSVLVGRSGVGKTTLLNTIQPGLGLRVEEVSEKTDKGKHATSHLEMFPLDFGGSVIDTPGMREFGLWNAKNVDIASLFREMRPFIGHCRFGLNCSHTHEPECAIKDAVNTGEISEHRYDSYVRMKK
jgi:ribosome biogenesis GTPase